MIINLSPVRSDEVLDLSVVGDVISLNGVELDFSPLPEGGVLPFGAIDNPWMLGDVIRQDGQITLTVVLPHGPDATESARFPEPISVTTDGPVELPV